MIDAAFLAVDDDDSGMLSASEIDHAFFGGVDHLLLSLEHAGTHSRRSASHVPPAGPRKTKSKREPAELDWIKKDLDDRIMQLCSEFVPALSLQVHLSQYHRKRDILAPADAGNVEVGHVFQAQQRRFVQVRPSSCFALPCFTNGFMPIRLLLTRSRLSPKFVEE